jgi:hypothetical protein
MVAAHSCVRCALGRGVLCRTPHCPWAMPRPFLSQLLSTAHMKQEMKFESEKSPEKPEEIVLYTTPTPLLEH